MERVIYLFMNSIYKQHFFRHWTPVAIGLLAVLLIGFISTSVAADTPVERTGRLISIYDRGTEKVVVTKAPTVAEVLQKAEIEMEPGDSVEPALDTELVSNNYQINVYRARPVVVQDGQNQVRIMTSHQSPRQIAEAANISLYEEDDTSIDRVDDVLEYGGAGLRMTVDRALPFTLVLYGKTVEARTQGETVAEMLEEKKIILSDNDTVSLPLDTPMKKGMKVAVWRNGVQTINEEQEIDFEVEEIKDADRPVGFREVKTPGEKGTRMVTFEVDMLNGEEKSRKEIQNVVTKEPKKEVVIVGTRPNIPGAGDYSGNPEQWMRAAGIPESEWDYVNFIVQRESGWNPAAVNPTSGACGLAQALPCSKISGDWSDPVNALRWQHGYVQDRYGSYAEAYAFWQANRWY